MDHFLLECFLPAGRSKGLCVGADGAQLLSLGMEALLMVVLFQ